MTDPRPPGVRTLIGTQGWVYEDWAGTFYPEGTSQPNTLRVYARAFDTVEVDSSFYATPSASTVRGWAERTPDDFVFTLKMPREITHDRRMVGAGEALRAFLKRVETLEHRLGPILVQLPPDFTPAARVVFAEFLPLLPRDFRFAVEFRHSGWVTGEVHDLLAAHGIAFALSDGPWIPRKWLLQLLGRPTAEFHYIRWMGPDRSLTSFASVQLERGAELDEWADAMRSMPERGLDVFAYFSNFFEGHAPASARSLQRRLGMEPADPSTLDEQTSLF